LIGGHHQQIGIREASPITRGQGAVAEGFSAGVQPDPAVAWPRVSRRRWRSAVINRCRSRRRRGAKVQPVVIGRVRSGKQLQCSEVMGKLRSSTATFA
jgi:hypothetical protein